MADRIYNVAQMLKDCYSLRNKAESEPERHYFEREIYKWKNELMSNGINPDSIDDFEFQVKHGAFSKYPTLERQAWGLLNH